MQVLCDHCGNRVFASGSSTGIVDEWARRIGWRQDDGGQRRPAGRRASSTAARDEAAEVARELSDLGLDSDASEVEAWLAEDADRLAAHAPAGLGGLVDRLERAEASYTPMRQDVLEALSPGTVTRADIAWQRTAEGLLACSGHCFEQLSFCLACNLPRSAPAHRGCPSYVPPCSEHTAEILRFPG